MFKLVSIGAYAAWGINVILLAVLADVIRKYQHQRDFPAFANYVWFSLVKSVLLITLSVWSSSRVYFYAYWIAQLLVLSLLVCVVHEVFESVTERASWLSAWGKRRLIRIATGASAVVITASLWFLEPSRYPIMDVILGLQRGIGLAIFAFMAVIVIFSRTYNIPWHRRDSGIVQGVLVAFSFQTLWPSISAFLSGHPSRTVYATLMFAFDTAALLLWIYSFLRASQSGDFIDLPVINRKFRLIRGGKPPARRSAFGRAS